MKHPISTPEEVESYSPPDPDREGLRDSAKLEVEDIDRSQSLVFGDNGWGIFERAWLLVGMEKLLKWMLKKPEAVETLMSRITKIKKRITERFIEEIDVDGIKYGDDWGGEHALIMNPNLWRELIKPNQKKLYDVCNDNEVIVHQHTDGHIEDIIPDLIEIGLDILNPLQPSCNDVEKIKSEFERDITFHGVVSSRVMNKGNPEEVKKEVKKRVNQLDGNGGYILAPAHSIDYPKDNIDAFRKAAKKYCKIPNRWMGEYQTDKVDVEV